MAVAECIFCRIVRRQAPASVVYEDADTMAFMDIRPLTPGHALVIPKVHAAHLADLPPEAGMKAFETSRKVAEALRASGLRCEGVNLHLADGEVAGQEIFHVHIHVIPRFEGDGFGLRVPPDYGGSASREELDRAAERVRRGLGTAPHG